MFQFTHKRRITALIAAFSLCCVLMFGQFARAAGPPASQNLPNAGEQGYASLHKYVYPTSEPGVYRVKLSVYVVPVVRKANVVFVINSNGDMGQANDSTSRSALAEKTVGNMIDNLYDSSNVMRDKIDIAFLSNALGFNDSGVGPTIVPGGTGTVAAPTLFNPASPPPDVEAIISRPVTDKVANNIVDASIFGQHFMSVKSYETPLTGFSTFNDIWKHASIFDGFNQTNQAPQFGLHKANTLLNTKISSSTSSKNDLKYIIFFTDGFAQASAATAAPSSLTINWKGGVAPSTTLATNARFIETFSSTAGSPDFDYSKLLYQQRISPIPAGPYWWSEDAIIPASVFSTSYTGDLNTVGAYANSFSGSNSSWVYNYASRPIAATSTMPAGTVWGSRADPISVASAIWEAEQIKNDNTTIFSIGWENSSAGADGREVFSNPSPTSATGNFAHRLLTETASPVAGSYAIVDTGNPTGATAQLNTMLDAIKDSILKALNKGGTVVDTLGEHFTLTKFQGQSQFEVSAGTVSFNNGEIQWDIPNTALNEGEQTLSYYVKIDDDVDQGSYYPTNGYAYLSYTDVDGNDLIQYFAVPYAKPTTDGTAEPKNTATETTSIEKTNEQSSALIPKLGIAGNGGVPYTPSVTPSTAKIENEKLEEKSEAVPVTSSINSQMPVVIYVLVGLAIVSVAGIILKKTRR